MPADELMTAAQAATLKRLAHDAYELDACDGGTVRPLTINSYFVGNCTGRSAVETTATALIARFAEQEPFAKGRLRYSLADGSLPA